nr:unnamed protein product [Callosobruchus analis]
MIENVAVIVFLLIQLCRANRTDYCGNIDLYETRGTMEVEYHPSVASIYCNWTIHSGPETITTVKILHSETTWCYKHNECCLFVSDGQRIIKRLCNDQIDRPKALSIRTNNPMYVVLEAKHNNLELLVSYTIRNATECSYSEFQCSDKSSCYNQSDMCTDNFICQDYSHNLGCSPCHFNSSLCDTTYRICFDNAQRCDGIVHCPKGEDELNCTDKCVGMIMCANDNICISKDQVCDRSLDCPSGMDEQNCDNINPSKSIIILTLFVMCSLCSVLFICLVFRWVTSRRDMNRLLNDLPEFPLAPFQGPGEQDQDSTSSGVFGESEFRQGGGIYESYMMTIKKRSISKSVQAGAGVYNHNELDGDNELVVLASLNVPLDSCVGLSISEDNVSDLASRGSIKTTKYHGNADCSTSETYSVFSLISRDTKQSTSKSSMMTRDSGKSTNVSYTLKVRPPSSRKSSPTMTTSKKSSSAPKPARSTGMFERGPSETVIDPIMMDLIRQFDRDRGDRTRPKSEGGATSDGQWVDVDEEGTTKRSPEGNKMKRPRTRSGNKKGILKSKRVQSFRY